MGLSAVQFSQRDDYASKRDLLRERIGELPPPRVWTREQLAEFLGVKASTIWDRTRRNSTNPIPHCPGVKLLKFDTQNVEFLLWLAKWLGIYVGDLEG